MQQPTGPGQPHTWGQAGPSGFHHALQDPRQWGPDADPAVREAVNRLPYREPPPRRRGGWKRALAIVALAVGGWFLGTVIGGVANSGFATLVGMWVGLALGLGFGVWVTRRRV